MKQHFLLKSGCSILIGIFSVLLPLGAAQAVEWENPMPAERLNGSGTADMQSTTPSDAAPSRQYDDQSTPRGARGPMRSDMPLEKSTPQKESTTRHDINAAERSPYLVPDSEGGLKGN